MRLRGELLVLACLAIPGARAGELPHHCGPRETVVFDCAIGRKRVSVCGADDAPGASYRFGSPGKPALVLPDPASPADTRLAAGTLTFSGGGGAYLRFRRADFDYIVYAAVGRGWGTKEGVVVEQGGKRLAALRCRGEAQSRLGPDWFSRAGIPGDTLGFDLP